MSSHSEPEPPGRFVRPVTWAILAWMTIMIAAILGAWKGAEARFGVLSEITVTTDRSTVKALPFIATDLEGNSFTNPVPEFVVRGERTLTVRLSTELRESRLNVYEVREGGTSEYTVEAGGAGRLRIPVSTPEYGPIEGLAIRSIPIFYDEAGEPSILNGEWSASFVYED